MIIRLPRGWFPGRFHSGGILPGRTERLPSVDILILTLDLTPDEADQCVHVHRDKPAERLSELWIDKLGVWVRFDGFSYSGDLGRGYAYPGRWDRWRLRRAIRRWRKRRNV